MKMYRPRWWHLTCEEWLTDVMALAALTIVCVAVSSSLRGCCGSAGSPRAPDTRHPTPDTTAPDEQLPTPPGERTA